MQMTYGLVKQFLRSEDGATAIEYALIAVGMVLAIIAAFPSITTAINTRFSGIGTSFSALGG